MDMQDKETEFVPPGVMQPDNTMLPAEPELSEMTGGATVQVGREILAVVFDECGFVGGRGARGRPSEDQDE